MSDDKTDEKINLFQDLAEKIQGTDLNIHDCFFDFFVTFQNIMEMKRQEEEKVSIYYAKLLLEYGYSVRTASICTKLPREKVIELQKELQEST